MGLTSAFSKKGGGGRLNNVDGVVQDYQFSDTFPYESKQPKKKGDKAPYPSLWLNLTILADGATEPVVEPLFAGNVTQWDISEDGHTITPTGDDSRLFGSGPRFLQSMFDNGFDEPEYEEGGEIDLSDMINQRFRFIQVVDEEATKKRGKQVDKKDPTKSYDRKTLEVSGVLGEVEVAAKGKSNGKVVASKANGKGKSAEVDHTDEATTTLMAILEGNDGEINRAKLGTPALRILLKSKSANKDAVLAMLKSEEFLGAEDGWSYNAKSGVIETA